jgi:hypothetical protein
MSKKSDTEFLTLTQMNKGVRFYHRNDELTFYRWLGSISCVDRYCGDGKNGLVVHLKRRPRKEELRELLALCRRWDVDMSQFAKFETAKNRALLRDFGVVGFRDDIGGPAP